jgi:hypothetical protein
MCRCLLQVLRDERLRQAIEAAAQNDYSRTGEKDDEVYKSIVKRHESRATKILYDMRSTMSDFLLRYDSLMRPFILLVTNNNDECLVSVYRGKFWRVKY